MKNDTTVRTKRANDAPDKLLCIGDIHASHLFEGFIAEFSKESSGESYHVVLSGDLFDRNYDSFSVYETVRRLHEEGRLTMCLGNHCVFLLGLGLRAESQSEFAKKARSVLSKEDLDTLCSIFSEQLYSNGGNETIASFERAYGSDLPRKMDEIIDFLAGFGLYAIDPANNLLVHGGLPLMIDGSTIGETIGGKFVSGFDYLRELDVGLRNLDRNTLFRLMARGREFADHIFADMERNGAVRDPAFVKGNYSYPVDFLATWFCNRVVTDPRYPETHKALRAELDRHGFGRQICGHWFNDSKTFGKPDDPEMAKYGDTILRLDRASLDFGNFGFAVVNVATNAIEEVGDAVDFMRKRR